MTSSLSLLPVGSQIFFCCRSLLLNTSCYITYCICQLCDLGQVINLFNPQFLHMQKNDNDNINFIRLLWGLSNYCKVLKTVLGPWQVVWMLIQKQCFPISTEIHYDLSFRSFSVQRFWFPTFWMEIDFFSENAATHTWSTKILIELHMKRIGVCRFAGDLLFFFLFCNLGG